MQLSVLKSVEIVGEAAAQVSEDVRRVNPDIPWREIVGMRNRLVHAYSTCHVCNANITFCNVCLTGFR